MGVYNADERENKAFLSFSRHFFQQGLPVPEILFENLENNIYLIEDLGDETLLSFLTKTRKNSEFPDSAMAVYKAVIDKLPEFQIQGGKGLDYSACYPRAAFDQQSMMWDLNYFKYYFLKLAKIPFDEQHLEDDFQTFTDFLLEADRDYFLYRDFQSRNIMIKNGQPYFIDYQGGRKGALQYDLASLLYEAKTDIPQQAREELLEYYLQQVALFIPFDRAKFLKYYYGYTLIRLLQAMGAYGFRGFYEKKPLFLQSIPGAIKNLEWLLENAPLDIKIPALKAVLKDLTKSEELRKIGKPTENKLKVSISSFSYRRGIPADETRHGGGFVFDCRAIPNPGRFDQYKSLTGKDKEVIEFFSQHVEAEYFLENVFKLIDMSVEEYKERSYNNLMVNFGCTGGQHRSVYSAEQLQKHLKQKYPDIEVQIRHREQELK